MRSSSLNSKRSLAPARRRITCVTAAQVSALRENFDRVLAYNRDELMANITRTTSVYTQSSADFGLASSTDLSGFKQHHGKLIMYGGRADPAVSSYENAAYCDKVNQAQHGTAAQFVRLFLVPGMNHGAGGPSTDRFDALAALEAWVERGLAPDSIPASATSPGYFGVASRTRPLCAYPHWAHYKGAGDINDAGSFACLRSIPCPCRRAAFAEKRRHGVAPSPGQGEGWGGGRKPLQRQRRTPIPTFPLPGGRGLPEATRRFCFS